MAQVDPADPEVRVLLAGHLQLVRLHSDPEDVHALDPDGPADPALTLFALHRDGVLLGVAGLRELDTGHGEVKAMHTVAAARGTGVGRLLLLHLLGVAASRGYRRVSLETGSQPAFAPARALYASTGFTACGPFGGSPVSPASAFLTKALDTPGTLEP